MFCSDMPGMVGNNMPNDPFSPPTSSNMQNNPHAAINRPPGAAASALGASPNVGLAQEKLVNALKNREMQVRMS